MHVSSTGQSGANEWHVTCQDTKEASFELCNPSDRQIDKVLDGPRSSIDWHLNLVLWIAEDVDEWRQQWVRLCGHIVVDDQLVIAFFESAVGQFELIASLTVPGVTGARKIEHLRSVALDHFVDDVVLCGLIVLAVLFDRMIGTVDVPARGKVSLVELFNLNLTSKNFEFSKIHNYESKVHKVSLRNLKMAIELVNSALTFPAHCSPFERWKVKRQSFRLILSASLRKAEPLLSVKSFHCRQTLSGRSIWMNVRNDRNELQIL